MKQTIFCGALAAAFLLASPAEAEDRCPATTAEGAVTQIDYKDGHVVGSGTWAVGGGATGALLEFRVDNDRLAAETRTGTSGTWSIVESFAKCDRPLHALRVLVIPSVGAGEGSLRHCLGQQVRSEPLQFQFHCGARVTIEHCTWECEEGACAGLCAVSATGGRLPYLLFRGTGEPDDPQAGDSSQGTWTVPVTCKQGETVAFTVHDNFGRGRPSPPAARACGEE
ncbi:MAG TPA: hypothetical protein DD490_13180 [Acidobacteria bacterium]|nr:hypothetical protein [Acidobacteriota bacterium]